jgi:hypothetical protein
VGGSQTLLDVWWSRWRGDDGLTERLRPYQARSVADQALEWLDNRSQTVTASPTGSPLARRPWAALPPPRGVPTRGW